MLQRLARVARQARLDAGLTQLDIGTAAGVSNAVMSRFETAKHYPEKLDVVVAAYEKECGLSEGELWKRAAGLL